MGKGSGKHSGNDGDGKGALGREDFQLWKDFTHDIEPLEEPDWETQERLLRAAPQQKKTQVATVETTPTQRTAEKQTVQPSLPEQAPQLDARTEARLRRGQMPVEARLDLHGCTQDEAHRKLNEFVTGAQARGKRCVLVITGKGLSRGKDDERTIGVLRQKLPLWISMPPLRAIVLKSYPAAARDGGTGAWYLYLKRNRDY